MNKFYKCIVCNTESANTIKIHNERICRNCLESFFDSIKDDNNQNAPSNSTGKSDTDVTQYQGEQLVGYLKEIIKGQDVHLKKVVSIIITHFWQLEFEKQHSLNKNNTEEEKLWNLKFNRPNTILVGKSGTGKTQTMIEIIKLLPNIPSVIIDAATLTKTGYVGSSVNDILVTLLTKTNFDIKKAEHGIVIVDEFDKLSQNTEITGMAVQNEFLKMLDGTEYTLAIDSYPGVKENVIFNTSKLLFIGLGSFGGLQKIIDKRTNKNQFGFNEETTKGSENLNNTDPISSDLIEFGIGVELTGRFSNIIKYNELKEDDIKAIIKSKYIYLYQELFKQKGGSLTITEEAIDEIASIAMKAKTGVRSLNNIFSQLINDIIFQASNHDNDKEQFAFDINLIYVQNMTAGIEEVINKTIKFKKQTLSQLIFKKIKK